MSAKKIPNAILKNSGHANLTFSGNETSNYTDITVKFWGDTILDESVSTYEEAVKVYKNFSTLAKTSKAVVSFGLTPIDQYCDGTQEVLRQLSKGIADQSIQVLTDMELLGIELNSLLDAPAAVAYPNTIGSNLNLFKEKFSVFSLNFKQKLGVILPKIKGGIDGLGEPDLVNLIRNYETSPFELEKANMFLGRRNREVDTIGLFMQHKGKPGEGIVVEEDSSADGNKCRVDFSFLVEFALPVLPKNELVKDYLECNEQPENEQWFYNNRLVKEAGEVYKSFVEFYNLNKGNGVTCFIVGLKPIRNDQKPKIDVVGPGDIYLDDFKATTKLSFPENIFVTENSIQFSVDYKNDGIMNQILVTYTEELDLTQIKNNDNSATLQSIEKRFEVDPSGKTKVFLPDLHSNSDCKITLQLISILDGIEWAVGSLSTTLTVTTSPSSPPASLAASSKTDMTVSLGWADPQTQHVDLPLQYRVTAHRNGSCDSGLVTGVMTNHTSLTVENLQPITEYCFTVTAQPVNRQASSCTVALTKYRIKKLNCKHSTTSNLVVYTAPAPPTELQVRLLFFFLFPILHKILSSGDRIV